MKKIIYKRLDGQLCIVTPEMSCGLTVEEIALKDVPSGLPFKIVDTSYIPTDRTFRDAWDIDDAELTDGVGADYGVLE